MAFLYVLAFLPMGLLSPFGGVVADKRNRKAIIIICDAILAASGIAIAAWIALRGTIAEVPGTPMFFTIDGIFMLVLGTGIALSKSVRQLD